MIILNEYTKNRLINNTKSFDDSRRFNRRLDIPDEAVNVARVGMLELVNSNNLAVRLRVKNYNVDIIILDYKPILLKYLDSRKFRNKSREFIIYRSIRYAMKYNHIKISCSCPDFRYRFSYKASVKGYKAGTLETRPSNITNPNLKGGVCKHIAKVVNRPTLWMPSVVTAVSRYVQYMSDSQL